MDSDPPFDGQHDVRGATSAGTGEEEGHPAVHVRYRPSQSL